MIPPCYNRPPRALEYVRHVLEPDSGVVKLQRLPQWYEDRCATHDGTGIGPNGENYPTAHGYECQGCRWYNKETMG